MRLVHSFIALAALSTAAACADSAGITAPASASREVAAGGTRIGSANLTASPDEANGAGWGGGDASMADAGGWAGSGNVIAPPDSTRDERGGWAGSGN